MAVSTLPVRALAEDAPQQFVESNPAKAQRNPRAIPLIGAGHTATFELSVSDTRSTLLSHSYGVGAFGVISAVPEVNVEHASLARIARFMLDMHAAGGESGFDGALAVDFGHGTRWPAMGHGFMVRGGADLKLAGNHQYYFSAFDAPTIDAGYQYMGFGRVVEVSFRSSLLWDGRFRVDEGPTKNLPTTLGWGGLFEAGAPPLWVSIQFLHGAGLSRVESNLCSILVSTWSLCTRLTHVTDGWPLGDSVRHLTVGSLGLGVTMPKE